MEVSSNNEEEYQQVTPEDKFIPFFIDETLEIRAKRLCQAYWLLFCGGIVSFSAYAIWMNFFWEFEN